MKHLSNIELDQEFAVVVKSERKITHEVLLYIQEINRRSLHIVLGYDSLRHYLIKRHHYSEGSANRRIRAMLMLIAVPEIKEKIIEGTLNLSQLAVAQSAIQHTQNKEKRKISSEEKASLLLELENKTLDETKAKIANTLNIEIKEKKPITYGKDNTAYLNMKLTKEELAIVQECLQLMSHQAKDAKELLINFCKRAIKTKKELKSQKKFATKTQKELTLKDGFELNMTKESTNAGKTNIQNENAKSTQSAAAQKSGRNKNQWPRSRYVTANLRRQVFIRDNFMCHFIGEDGHICGSKMFLQPHHIIPFARGGQHSLENLSLRCGTHNLFEAERDGLNIFK